jgi:uncharacterized membrane protein
MESVTRFVDALVNVHPPHASVVHFPIALTGAALLFLLLALWRRSEALEQAAFFNVALAAVSSAAAGLTGYRDHLVRFEGETPYVGVKIFLGVSLFVLTAVLAYGRWRQPEVLWKSSTMVLYVAGFVGSFVLAAALGFTGGVIVYGW